MMHDFLDRRGLRSSSTIKIVSPMPRPIPISAEASQGILDACGARDIGWWPESKITSLDPSAKTAALADGRATHYDLLLGVPVHRAPRRSRSPPSLQTTAGSLSTPRPSPPGSRTSTRSAGHHQRTPSHTSVPLPKARPARWPRCSSRQSGAARIPIPTGASPRATSRWEARRWARFDADFLSGPTPVGTFTEASEATAASKVEFGATRRKRWFDLES